MKKYREIAVADWKLKEWADLENRNAHGLRLERIADTCYCFADGEGRAELYAIQCMLNALNCQHDRLGQLPGWLYEIRQSLRARLCQVIKAQFGPEALELINP